MVSDTVTPPVPPHGTPPRSAPPRGHSADRPTTATRGRTVVNTVNLTKWFPLGRQRVPLLSLLRNRAAEPGSSGTGIFAIDGVSVTIAAGQKVGIVGNNGSGKTSMLKLLAGLYRPTSGTVALEGRVTLLSGLGLGMLDELSVVQNIYLYGALNGLLRDEIRERISEILSWAELTDFADAKLKTLSKGMRTRVAFSTTRHIVADVYLFDEALSGGDQGFRQKCLEVLASYRDTPGTYLVSSHSKDLLRAMCDQVLWLHHGKRMALGDASDVLDEYERFVKTNPGR